MIKRKNGNQIAKPVPAADSAENVRARYWCVHIAHLSQLALANAIGYSVIRQ